MNGDGDARPGAAVWTPIACGTALAIVPWLNDPISRRRPFMCTYRAAHTTGEPTSTVNTASSTASRLATAATYSGRIGVRSRSLDASASSFLRVLR